MKFLPIIALLGLGLTIVPPLLHLLSDLSQKTTFTLMAVGMVVWYLAATPWIFFKKEELDTSTQDHI
jgi:predicted membrane channel-forming protein YqfA (hemolysin III family)